ncbi:unnamed protein product [Vitrella brassicaformis CCMP3155]|uniref:Uncharacterized protein n=1 Tax=Vitrella brassicaformis (strain CCMP3155) TaxID=1169540 RepID=A0A0G4GPW2_VITBC|nr:unnamed protein product [Vitrella brassicaformis CCMP3155]|eukprot:CEM32406.1 unnamed protein product [Vitrella brassicaformis CCMP3155]
MEYNAGRSESSRSSLIVHVLLRRRCRSLQPINIQVLGDVLAAHTHLVCDEPCLALNDANRSPRQVALTSSHLLFRSIHVLASLLVDGLDAFNYQLDGIVGIDCLRRRLIHCDKPCGTVRVDCLAPGQHLEWRKASRLMLRRASTIEALDHAVALWMHRRYRCVFNSQPRCHFAHQLIDEMASIVGCVCSDMQHTPQCAFKSSRTCLASKTLSPSSCSLSLSPAMWERVTRAHTLDASTPLSPARREGFHS